MSCCAHASFQPSVAYYADAIRAALCDELLASAITPSLHLYNTIIGAYPKAGQLERSFALLEEMEAKFKLSPDLITYRWVCSLPRRISRAVPLSRALQ